MPKSFNSRPKGLSMTSLIMILYALIMHDDHAINQIEVLKKKKKKKKKKIFRPTYPNFLGHVTGNTHTFLFGLICGLLALFYIFILCKFYSDVYVFIFNIGCVWT